MHRDSNHVTDIKDINVSVSQSPPLLSRCILFRSVLHLPYREPPSVARVFGPIASCERKTACFLHRQRKCCIATASTSLYSIPWKKSCLSSLSIKAYRVKTPWKTSSVPAAVTWWFWTIWWPTWQHHRRWKACLWRAYTIYTWVYSTSTKTYTAKESTVARST